MGKALCVWWEQQLCKGQCSPIADLIADEEERRGERDVHGFTTTL